MDYETVALDDEKNALVIIDQTKLPGKMELLELTRQEDIWNAIYLLQVRGAPAIGVAAAIGIYLAAREIKADTWEEFYPQFIRAKKYLDSARPTAVNLSWALNRMDGVCRANREKSVEEIVQMLHDTAVEIRNEDVWVCKSIGEYGLSLVKPGNGLLTHCNARKLATVNTVLLRHRCIWDRSVATTSAFMRMRQDHFLQGARLTAFELCESGFDVTVICDNMSATVMKNRWVDAVFVGCDRVAANGDTANKIGTSVVATVAKRYNVPVYVCAPTSTIDLDTPTGDDIKIEQRPAQEVTEMWYRQRMAPAGVKVFNPSFDVTDNDLITGIITEYGIARPPYTESFKEIFAKKEAAERHV